MATLAIVLTVLGGLSEAGGLLLVARGIKRDRDRARRLLARYQPPEPLERTYPPRASPGPLPAWANPTFTVKPQDILRRLQALKATTANVFIEIKKTVDEDLDKATLAVRQELSERDGELREVLHELLGGRRWTRQ